MLGNASAIQRMFVDLVSLQGRSKRRHRPGTSLGEGDTEEKSAKLAKELATKKQSNRPRSTRKTEVTAGSRAVGDHG